MQRYLAVSEARQQFLKLVDETLEGDEINYYQAWETGGRAD